jgi:hypothetical protein
MWFMFVPKGLTAPCPRCRVYGSPVGSLSTKSELDQEYRRPSRAADRLVTLAHTRPRCGDFLRG